MLAGMAHPTTTTQGRTRRGLFGLLASVPLARVASARPTATALHLPGASASVEIVTDRWGIPHITAASQQDAFFGQGYAAAIARLWQLDLVRRRVLGRLAAAGGRRYLPFDVAARTRLFRGDVAAEWAHHDPRVKPLAQAWVRGVNARIGQVLADIALLPPEFHALDMQPEPWGADDLILLRGGWVPNLPAEMRRAVLACRGALALDALVQPLDPPVPLRVPDGLDPCRLSPGQLDLYHLWSAPLPELAARRHSALGPADTPVAVPHWADADAQQGSNAWAIAPARTGTGRAVLANDPHLPVSVPGPRFISHLRAPGLDAIGTGPAFLPAFFEGHNNRIAFGRTDFQIDQEDLYVLELDATGEHWRRQDGWQPVTRITDTIAVRDGPAETIEIRLTSLGPLVFEDKAARHALVVRSVLRECGLSGALDCIPVALAGDWRSFRAAIATAVHGSNYLYADVDANIGWQVGGRSPRRVGYDGLMPVPAAGRYDWSGYLAIDELPSRYNPPEGWLASANQMPFPPGWPADRVTSHEWIADDRYRRIVQVLAPEHPHAAADSLRLQQDTLSLRAGALLPLLDAMPGDGREHARVLLRGWHRRIDADSPAAALFEAWFAELSIMTRQALVPAPLQDVVHALHPQVLVALLTGADPALGSRRLDIATQALTAAVEIWTTWWGGSPWGAVHRLELHHALAALLPDATVPGGPSGGDATTVMGRWWGSLSAPVVTGGASYRQVIEPGNWDAARCINMPGQSGEPGSPHYADLVPLWLANQTIPLAYAPDRYRALEESVLRIEPAG